jgi:hydrogenase maturation protease
LPAGQLHFVQDAEVPRFLGAKKLSLHQTGFQEVLSLAELTGNYPRQVLLIGCQPAVLDDYGGSLSPQLRAAVEPAVQRALAELAVWGAELQPRAAVEQPSSLTPPTPLDMARYEAERPSEATACRVGDARFLPRIGAAVEES